MAELSGFKTCYQFFSYIGTTDKANDVKVFKNGEKTEITAIAEGRNENEIVLGYGSGNVDIFDTTRCCFIKKIDDLEGSESIAGKYKSMVYNFRT